MGWGVRRHHHMLVGLRCDEVQGYLFGKPMPASRFTATLLGRAADPALPILRA